MTRPFANTETFGNFDSQRPNWDPTVDWVGADTSPLFSMIQTGEVATNPVYEWFATDIAKTGAKVPNIEGANVIPDAAQKSEKYRNLCEAFIESASLSVEAQATESRDRLTQIVKQEMAKMAGQWQEMSFRALGRDGSKLEIVDSSALNDRTKTRGKIMSSIQNYLGGDVGNVVTHANNSGGEYDPATGLTSDVDADNTTALSMNLIDRALLSVANKGVKAGDYCMATRNEGYIWMTSIANSVSNPRQIITPGSMVEETAYVSDFQTSLGYNLKFFGTPYMNNYGTTAAPVVDILLFNPKYVSQHWMNKDGLVKMQKRMLAHTGPTDSFYLYSLWTVSLDNPNRHAVIRAVTAPTG